MLIAQITDTHVKHAGKLAYGRVDTLLMLERAVAHLRRLDPQPDVVLLTGDLVDDISLREEDPPVIVLTMWLTPLRKVQAADLQDETDSSTED